MIVSKDTNPERDVYYLGAMIIELISDSDREIDFFDLFRKMNESEKVSMSLYSLTLDWLFIIGVIDNSQKGQILRCF